MLNLQQGSNLYAETFQRTKSQELDPNPLSDALAVWGDSQKCGDTWEDRGFIGQGRQQSEISE